MRGKSAFHEISPSGFMRRRARGLAAVLAALAGAGVPAARADDAQSAGDLGDIVVQARRRTERLVDAPVAVTVQTSEQLKDQDALLFSDVARQVPNVRMMPSPQSVSALDVTMRGQTAIRSAIDYDPAVGIYVDGVYVANGQAAMNTLLDIDTVEIVRGAQGTLFGRNNTGGSVSFTTMRPQTGGFSAEAAASAGTLHAWMGRAIVNLPVADTVAVRVAFQQNRRDGYGASVATGQGDFENQDRSQARVGVLWRPGPDADAYWTYEHFQADEAGALLHPLRGTQVEQLGQTIGQVLQQFPVPGVLPVVFPDNPFQTGADLPSHDHTHLDATQLTVHRALDAATHARLILGYRHLHNDTAIDVDATSLPFANTQLFNTSSQKSAELQLSGLALEHRLDWVGGLYWFRDDGSAPSLIPPPSAAYQTVFGLLNQAAAQADPACQGNPLLPQCTAVAYSPYSVVESNSIQNRSAAAFVHGEYRLTERWAVAAGLRHTNDTRKLSENAYQDTPGGQVCTIVDATTGLPANLGGPCPAIDRSVDFSYWSWELSSRYRVSEHVNAYFRSGRGQRSGGWNVPVNTLQDQPFHPEQITDYEVGVKSDLLGGALMVNGDVFHGNYDQMQRLLPRLVGGTPTTFVVNAGRARVDGAELEAALHLSRSTSVDAALGWTDARYRDFTYAASPLLPAADLTGNRFYQTPRFNAGLGAGYDLPLAGGHLRLHGDYAWQSAVQFNVINDFNAQGAYGTLNARAAFDAGTWECAFYGTNITGRQYALTGGSVQAPPATTPAISWQIAGAPRLVGLEFTYRFGAGRGR